MRWHFAVFFVVSIVAGSAFGWADDDASDGWADPADPPTVEGKPGRTAGGSLLQDEAAASLDDAGWDLPDFAPEVGGGPASRVGGGTRGADRSGHHLDVLAPEGIDRGLASIPDPQLTWYVSQATDMPVEIVVLADDEDEPLYESMAADRLPAGFNTIDLAALGKELRSGVIYQWTVALVTDETQRSNDIISQGAVVHIPPDSDLTAALAAADTRERVKLLVRNGYWYDALSLLEDAVADPEYGNRYRSMRVQLLEREKLGEPAKWDQGQSSRTATP